jgi:hypothetical protein
MLKYTKGDLIALATQGEFDVVMHGCNCFNAMGAGIAKQFAAELGVCRIADYETQPGDIFKLGGYSKGSVILPGGKELTVVNLYTQFYPGSFFEYSALHFGLDFYLTEHLPKTPTKIGIPKIGSGIGGGDWNMIEVIVEKIMTFHSWVDLTVVEYVNAR